MLNVDSARSGAAQVMRKPLTPPPPGGGSTVPTRDTVGIRKKVAIPGNSCRAAPYVWSSLTNILQSSLRDSRNRCWLLVRSLVLKRPAVFMCPSKAPQTLWSRIGGSLQGRRAATKDVVRSVRHCRGSQLGHSSLNQPFVLATAANTLSLITRARRRRR